MAAPGKLVGVGLFPEPPVLFRTLVEILDHVPGYAVITLAAPIGLPDTPQQGGRECERQARRLLGWPRMGAVLPTATRAAARAADYESACRLNGGRLSPASWGQRGRLLEVFKDLQPHHQRYVYEVHPELSFYQLNEDRPLAYSKHSDLGEKERAELLAKRLPGADKHLDVHIKSVTRAQIMDAFVGLWTARRIAAKAATRIPADPVWNKEGLRMEILR